MKRFIDGPGTGKTRELVKAAFEALEQGENSTLVCCDIEEMKQRIYAMGYD